MTKSKISLLTALVFSFSVISLSAAAQNAQQSHSISTPYRQPIDRGQAGTTPMAEGGAGSARRQPYQLSSPFVEVLPLSFFVGAISYGVGFPTQTTNIYSSGFVYTVSQTRFSGVQQRSPIPLIPPVRHQRHAPPSHHHGCRC
jgi:hypothetical protein